MIIINCVLMIIEVGIYIFRVKFVFFNILLMENVLLS